MVLQPKALRLALARRSLGKFAKLVQPSFEIAPVHAAVIEHLERLLSGDIKKLLLTIPPRHGKSLLSCIMTPAFALGRDPSETIILATYGSELSETMGRRTRTILTDPVFKEIFPGCVLSPDSASMYQLETLQGGAAVFTGRSGPITGRGASLLILDDLVKDQSEANSEATCATIVEWLQTVAFTRLTPNGRVLAIGTRWSQGDPLAFLLEQEGFVVLHLPALAEPNDPLGRKVGQALWPNRYSEEVLQKIRRDIGGRAFECLYQGNVSAAAGSIFKRAWFSYYNERPQKITRIIQSWDTSFKTGRTNDYSVCITLGETANGYYLLSLWRDKVEFPALRAQVALQADYWQPSEILVEDSASGQSLIQELKTATSYPVIAVRSDKDKESRAAATTGYYESGRILFPKNAPWLADLEDELAGFPGSLHDDQVDALSQAINRLRDSSGALSIIDFFKDLFTGKRKMPVSIEEAKAKIVVRGPAESRVEGNRGQPERPEPCKACGNPSTIWMSGGRPGAPAVTRCNQCSAIDGVAEQEKIGCEVGCPGFLSQVVGGRIRCGNCGAYHSPAPAAIGMSREQYGRRLNRFR